MNFPLITPTFEKWLKNVYLKNISIFRSLTREAFDDFRRAQFRSPTGEINGDTVNAERAQPRSK